MPVTRRVRQRPLGRARDGVHRYVLVPAFETLLKRRRTFAVWRDLERSQWHTPDVIAARQLAQLQRLLMHAYESSPYYAGRWGRIGLDPRELRQLNDFARWPIVTPAELRRHRDSIRSQAPGLRFYAKSTSGSTGIPLTIEYDKGSLEHRMAAWFRAYAWAGAAPGVKQFYYWNVPIIRRSITSRTKDALHHWLYRRQVTSCMNFRSEDAERILWEYERARCPVIVSFSRPLYELCRVLRDRGLRPTPPQAIVVGAEKLYPFQRALIEDTFGAPVFETYGCREFMLVAAQCERRGGLHLTSEHLIVEIVDDSGSPVPPGRPGRVVITDLYNHGAPFIRYDVGDVAIMAEEQCACGRGLPLLREVTGRTLETILTPDHRRVPGEVFVLVLKDAPIDRYQVVQEAADRVVVRVQRDQAWPPEQQSAVLEPLRRVLGDRVALELEVVREIKESTAGKLHVVSNPWLRSLRSDERTPQAEQP